MRLSGEPALKLERLESSERLRSAARNSALNCRKRLCGAVEAGAGHLGELQFQRRLARQSRYTPRTSGHRNSSPKWPAPASTAPHSRFLQFSALFRAALRRRLLLSSRSNSTAAPPVIALHSTHLRAPNSRPRPAPASTAPRGRFRALQSAIPFYTPAPLAALQPLKFQLLLACDCSTRHGPQGTATVSPQAAAPPLQRHRPFIYVL